MAVIFAQLYVKDKWHGVHAFVVRLRDKDHHALKGVILGDCGPKIGFDNLDNGFIGFDNYHIPKDSLLNKHSDISDEGEFTSNIDSPDKRFAVVLGALGEARMGIIGASSVNIYLMIN
jgi:acyl-CoA oxidase